MTPLSVVIRILLATLLGGVIGLERSHHGHDAGLRTHIFICLGAAMTSVVGIYAVETLNFDSDPLRIAAQVVSGIGFLGAGTILVKNSSRVTGLTTAAGMWATATIGIAVGVGFYEAAILCTIICIVTATFLTMLEAKRKQVFQIYLEVEGAANTNAVINYVKGLDSDVSDIFTIPAKSSTSGNIGIMVTFPLESLSREEIMENLLQTDHVVMAVEE